MTARQQWLLVGLVVAVMGGGLFTASHFLRDELQQVTVGTKAPSFSAITLDERPVIRTLDAYRGQVVLLNVWGTFCIPCRKEMPSIEALHQAMQAKGLHVVAVSIDEPGKAQAIRDFVKEFKLSFEVLYDTSSTIATRYQTAGVPESFVIDRDGRIRRIMLGESDWNSEENRKLIELLLAEPAR